MRCGLQSQKPLLRSLHLKSENVGNMNSEKAPQNTNEENVSREMFLCCSNTMIHKLIVFFFKLQTQYGNHDAMVYLLAHMIEKTWLKYVAFLSAAAFLLLHFKWTM